MKISIVVAVSQNGIIGKDGKIPWDIPEDLKRFRKITEGHHVLMGRKTFESIITKLGKPLPKRVNLVLSRNTEFSYEGVFVFRDFLEAVSYAQKKGENELMVIGGREIYKLALPITDTLYLTRVLRNTDGNTYFPRLDLRHWNTLEQTVSVGTPETAHEFRKLERK